MHAKGMERKLKQLLRIRLFDSKIYIYNIIDRPLYS